MDASGGLIARAGQFEEELLIVEVGAEGTGPVAEPLGDLDEIYGALVLGLRDYVRKNGFDRVLVAVSGGIDSALVAMIAADALGGDKITGVVMPSPHSSAETQEDARRIVRNLGADLVEIPIEAAMGAYDAALDGQVEGRRRPRRREPPGPDPGQYGDGPLERARLARPDDRQQERDVGRLRDALRGHGGWVRRDQGRAEDARLRAGAPPKRGLPTPLVPPAVIERPPSAELRPDQLDSDSLPSYDVLDRILAAYVEGDQSRDEIGRGRRPGRRRRGAQDGGPRRVQAAAGAAGHPITAKAFGRDRRLPITNRFGG